MIKKVVFLLILLPIVYLQTCKKLHFLPMPREIMCGEESVELPDPCKILFHVKLPENKNEHIE